MLWIVHLLALVLFWPALFVTVPLHVIASKLTAKPQAAPPPLPGAQQRPAGHLPNGVVLGVIAAVVGGLFCMANSPPPEFLASMPVSYAPPAVPSDQPGVERFRGANDGGIYELISVEGPQTARKIITLREGPSGKMYSTRLYNCETLKVRQLGAAETIERMNAYKGPSKWADIVTGSIADGVGSVACRPR